MWQTAAAAAERLTSERHGHHRHHGFARAGVGDPRRLLQALPALLPTWLPKRRETRRRPPRRVV